ncbi:MAG: DUF4298 domain-containing protein [Lachnospiraceae bacterium]|nr:DUF4298 domain-containing protein [Lachnospiraceae bacterium]
MTEKRKPKTEKKPENPTDRIVFMEEIFDRAKEVSANANENPTAFLDYQSEIEKLEEYYSDERWKKDFALDEQGMLPKGLKRGVLSEDGIYNLLEQNREVLETVRKKFSNDPKVSGKIRFLGYEAFKKDILKNSWKVYGAEIYEDGELAYSFGDTKENVHPIYSCTKSILAIAVGIALDLNKIDLQKNILYYIPEKYTSGLSDRQKEKWGKISLHRLMTMSVPGFPFRAPDDNYMDFSLNFEDFRVDDNSFEYSNIPAYLVGVALTEALGEDAWEFIKRKILKPLDITDAKCSRCSKGYFYGASGMEMSVNDLSRIGLLLMNGGLYNRQRIVSEEYVKKATSVLQMNREGGYGYYIWKYRDGFSINGKFKQKCYILPKQKRIITYLADIEDGSNVLRESMEKHILGIEK